MSTYTPIASVTLSSAGSSVIFSSIPQTYTDLRLVINGNLTSLEDIGIRFNGDSNSNYSYTGLSGNGSTVTSNRQSSQTYMYVGSLDGSQSMTTYDFMNYSKNTMNKTIINRTSAANWVVYARVGLWRSTAEVTSISLTPLNNFASGTTFNLYGIANASITNTAKATGGDSITTDGTYWYHTFLSSGTFTPTSALSNVDYLVVAGGGGGGGNIAGGGGAGGMRCTVTATGGGGALESPLSLTAQAYTVTVGAGGAGTTGSTNAQGTDGNNSVFSTITATGGGGGGLGATGSGSAESGRSGGSGGGAGGSLLGSGTRVGGAGTANQGYAGGANQFSDASNAKASGGGGAGAVGGNGGSGAAGNGGAGVATSISGSSVTYAGGGGGGSQGTGTAGTGGTGGGGAGSTTDTVATSGTANRGGGGGGGGRSSAGGPGAAGGSGIVIIRYAV